MVNRARHPARPRPRAEDLIDAADENSAEMQHAAKDDKEGSPSESDLLSLASEGDSEADSATMNSSDAEDSESESDAPDTADQLKAVSFGALSRAQDSLARKRKRDEEQAPTQTDKLEAVRARLRDIKRARVDGEGESKGKKHKQGDRESSTRRRDGRVETHDGEDSDSDDGKGPLSRSSKHAPAAQSSRFQVSRRREVVAVPKSAARDPRFGALPGTRLNSGNTEKAYSFLEGYEEKEMGELRAAIKKSRNDGEKETLRRKLMSMENRKRSRVEKERRQKVVREHRQKEREAVGEGKKPFYLKKSEQKRLALVDRFEGMKAKDREKAVERRRKKEGQKEKKSMPAPRRIAG
ncbi:DUF947-domain-containing protein [Myriangium duriaei CBS 260.36]|uniref:rRNA biogenesis protein RRP36 n=1 Tax=Myriangium duriaei CBS 260.36 TaxID=1168546 RepID=A0A9P4MNE9_9PEZI|nr:DUF947-domain-containing protein [Myriangium duriaei CBS 260.36]